MRPAIWLVVALAGPNWADSSATRQAPSYTAASVVNAASNQANAYAANTFVSIYGVNLAYTTRGLTAGDISGNTLPTILPGTGVRVWVKNIPAQMYYVSPTQINVLLPTNIGTGSTELRVQVDSTYGPPIPITLATVAPALFQLDAQTVIGTKANGALLTKDAPGNAGDWVILYATGLGPTTPKPGYGEIPTTAAPLSDMASFGVLVDGVKVDPKRIGYAGVAPGFAGLYQINCQLPDSIGTDPEIQVTAGGVTSPKGVRLPVRGAGASP
ncbi:MAG: hypothetical protein JSU00_06690 [Acidobacteria bacterium]|nr:hypothetical protein [Acidobacteriota bacterium]